MKLLLTHGYFIASDEKEQEIMRPYAPLGILYLSAYMKGKGIPTQVYDTTFSTPEAFQTYLLEHKPPFVAIYVNLMTKLKVLESIRFIRDNPALKYTRIILGGPEVTHHDEAFLRHGADYIVRGEGEETLYDLISTLDAPMNPFLDKVDGISFINGKNEIYRTKTRAKIKNIDTLPFPDRKAIDLNQYFQAWKTHHGQSTASISTMRGCPYSCKWCSRAVYGLSYRRRSAKLVVEEIAWIQANYEVDTFWFVDDVFTVSHKWLGQFAEALMEAGVEVRYECITRADRMNQEVIDLLEATGCFRAWIGAESGSQRILDAMDRRVTVDQVREMIQMTQAQGIQAGTFIMLGYPGETEADIKDTIQHLVTSDPDLYTITVAYPIKGTPLYQEIEPVIIDPLPWEDRTDRDLDFKRTYTRRYYDYAVRRVYNEVNYHKSLKRKAILQAGNHRMRAIGAKIGMWWERHKSPLKN
ncbi:MAG TPA: B12-binding domain-containing radical SAM protein [Bacteroidetes bacterium]|nr:B12-binding domain-containing radical SAM protein [Bacteroidota bacterium]